MSASTIYNTGQMADIPRKKIPTREMGYHWARGNGIEWNGGLPTVNRLELEGVWDFRPKYHGPCQSVGVGTGTASGRSGLRGLCSSNMTDSGLRRWNTTVVLENGTDVILMLEGIVIDQIRR